MNVSSPKHQYGNQRQYKHLLKPKLLASLSLEAAKPNQTIITYNGHSCTRNELSLALLDHINALLSTL